MLFLKYFHISNRVSLLTASMRKFQEQNETFQANRAKMAEGLALALARKDQVFYTWHCPRLVERFHLVTWFQKSWHKSGRKYLQPGKKGMLCKSLTFHLTSRWKIIRKLYSYNHEMYPEYEGIILQLCSFVNEEGKCCVHNLVAYPKIRKKVSVLKNLFEIQDPKH